MKPLLWVGLVVLALGVASLFVALPRRENKGVKIGDVNVGVQVQHSERVSPVVSAVLVAAGAGLLIAGARRRGSA
jgi:hypothetical protein